MPKILLTNDDGPKSPLTGAFASLLASQEWCEELRIVIPAEEQSWIADAVTRFRNIHVKKESHWGQQAILAYGTPADCINLGIHSLFNDKPDIVFSGINMGTNAGLPFFLSSGTVGGATGSFLTGTKAIAFSAMIPKEIFEIWHEHNEAKLQNFSEDWKRIASICTAISEKLLALSTWEGIDIFSVNIPFDATLDTKIVITHLQKLQFEGLFIEVSENTFKHRFQGFSPHTFKKECSLTPSDFEILDANLISLTPISYAFRPHDKVITSLKELFE